MTLPSPLSGLVLSGGYSRRMQADKAGLLVHGETQLGRVVRLLREVCGNTFVSVRADQRDDPLRRQYPQIVDTLENAGPAAGILAALTRHPDHAWLVVAVDLPRMTADTLRHLVRSRDPAAMATAYRSSSDGLPEPLCAIWEPSSLAPLSAFISTGRQCPRKFLLNLPARIIDLEQSDALTNMNTPEDYAATNLSVASGVPA